VKRKIGAGEEKHTIPVQGSCKEHAEVVKLLYRYAKGVRQSLKDRFVDINDLSLFDVLHPSRVPKPERGESLMRTGGGSLMRTCMKLSSWMTVFASASLTWLS
jgi:hypothetical protein